MMYMVSWVSDNEKKFELSDSWSEALEVCMMANESPQISNWWLSLVADSDKVNHTPDAQDMEKDLDVNADWFNAVASLLPEDLPKSQIMATLFTLANRYWSEKEMMVGFAMMSNILGEMTEAQEQATWETKH